MNSSYVYLGPERPNLKYSCLHILSKSSPSTGQALPLAVAASSALPMLGRVVEVSCDDSLTNPEDLLRRKRFHDGTGQPLSTG
jgi:hypothetical protein